MLLLPEGLKREAWEPSKMLFRKFGSTGWEITFTVVFKGLSVVPFVSAQINNSRTYQSLLLPKN